MSLSESIVVVTVIVSAVTASVLGALTPELSGLLGVALGYGGKGLVGAK